MQKKRFLALLVAGTMAMSMAACGGSKAPAASTSGSGSDSGADSGSSAASGTMEIGFVVKSLADQHWIIVKAGAEARAKELGVNVNFVAPNAESDVQGQVDMVQTQLGNKVAALCLAPSSPETVLPVLQQAVGANIPVLAVDTDLPGFDQKVTFIGTGNEAAGRVGGDYAAKLVGSGKKAIILRGRLGDPTHDQRVDGIKAGLEAGGVEVLEIKAADAEAEKAMNATQDLMNVYPDIHVVCTTADSMAQGAQRAIENAGKDISVIGFDGTIPVVELVRDGSVIKASVAQSPYKMGQMGVEYAVKAAKGETIEKRIDTGAELVTAENAAEFLSNMNAMLGK